MRTIAIVNQKGGCGKTTTAINLGAELAHRGQRTLLVDLDPQGHCAAGLGVPEDSITRGIGEVLAADLRYDAGLPDIVWEVGSGLHLVPSTIRLAGLEASDGGLSDRHDRDRRLERVLGQVADCYDICIVDCSPSIGLLTFNALRAAEETLVPVETGYFALRGAVRQVRTIESLSERIGRPLDFFLLPTLHAEASPRACNVMEALRTRYSDRVTPVAIREHEELREAAVVGQSIREFAPESGAAADFAALAEWVLGHEQTSIATERADHLRATGMLENTDAPTPMTAAALPESVKERKPSLPMRVSSRVADVLQRVRGDRGASAHAASFVEMDRIPPSATRGAAGEPAQALEVVPSESEEDASTLPERYGAFAGPEGVRFLQPAAASKRMAITGAFCGWSQEGLELTLDRSGRFFELVLPLAPGRHEYQLIVDGEPGPDPHGSQRMPGLDGPDRSLIEVCA